MKFNAWTLAACEFFMNWGSSACRESSTNGFCGVFRLLPSGLTPRFIVSAKAMEKVVPTGGGEEYLILSSKGLYWVISVVSLDRYSARRRLAVAMISNSCALVREPKTVPGGRKRICPMMKEKAPAISGWYLI